MKKILVCLFLFVGLSLQSNAAHIDQLGINITLNSSDGNGNFSVKYDEYFGADGWMWRGSNWDSNYRFPGITTSIIEGTGSLSLISSPALSFQGLVDINGVETAGFGVTQISTQFINDTSDAALYSTIVDYNVVGYDNSQAYKISLSANDCCYVQGSGNTSFDGQLIIDISQATSVPEPSTLAIMCIALFGLLSRRIKVK